MTSTTDAAVPTHGDGRNRAPRRTALLAVMCVGMFLVQLDVTVVNVALPAIRSGLGASLAGQQWVVDGYAVALAALLLAGGTAGDRFGHRRIVLVGLTLFAVASLACGLAPGIGLLIAARTLQGCGAALLLPGTLAVITRAFPDRAEQARAVGVWAGASALALPAGPLIGGALVSGLGWRAVFLVNIPIIALAAPLTMRLVTDGDSAERARWPLDVPGVAAAALALGSAVFAVIEAGRGTATLAAVSAGLLSAASAVALVVRERTATAPMLPRELWGNRAFLGANTVAAAMNVVGIGTVFVCTLYLQSVQSHSAFAAGVMLLPLFLPLACLAPVTGRLTARFGPRGPMTAGLALGAAGSATFVGIGADSTYLRLLPVLLGLGIGMGLLTAAVVAAAVRSVPADRAGLASGVNNTARQAGGALAVAVYGAVAGTPLDAADFTRGLHVLGAGGCTLWLGAVALTWLTIRSQQR